MCAAFLLLPGFAFVWAGIFTEMSPLHWVVGMSALAIGSVAGFLITGLRLRAVPRWRRWGTYTIISAATTVVVIPVLFATWGLGYLGALERLLFIVILGWSPDRQQS